jgi:hypothetical protein
MYFLTYRGSISSTHTEHTSTLYRARFDDKLSLSHGHKDLRNFDEQSWMDL